MKSFVDEGEGGGKPLLLRGTAVLWCWAVALEDAFGKKKGVCALLF